MRPARARRAEAGFRAEAGMRGPAFGARPRARFVAAMPRRAAVEPPAPPGDCRVEANGTAAFPP
ncbi:hypothetical protein GCM10010964_22230 [Caldovatus sediminis]|uniref:Uncharacterized protein n=1 Tax=Caldovatus sediminis TaxID=2041189 RepID=A0A8J2ZBX0_9PROT|nr:hypothetical protein GCM10010964_22230 [Caldovatus sediminis]